VKLLQAMGEQEAARGRRLSQALRRIDADPRLQRLARALRDRLPGDALYGDPLSVAGDDPAGVLGRRLAALSSRRPSALREAGFGALQVWQTLSEAQGRGHGDRELAILFTDLVGFSSWALEAGDELAVDLLRQVGQGIEPAVADEGGRVVKRLGDGLMAVFGDPGSAIEAACRARDAVQSIEVAGHRPRVRAGVHLGRPRKLGGDYYGVDVNIAARVAAAAGPDEILVSDAARERLDDDVPLRRRWRFSAKGAPKDLRVYSAALGQ
jgi:adenylate cyclase